MLLDVVQSVLQPVLQGGLSAFSTGGGSGLPPAPPDDDETFRFLVGAGSDLLLVAPGGDRILWDD